MALYQPPVEAGARHPRHQDSRAWTGISCNATRYASPDIRKATHKTIAAVTDDIERFHFNKAIARIRELTNLLEGIAQELPDGPQLYARGHRDRSSTSSPPSCPTWRNELWAQLGNKDMLSQRPWPKADPALLSDDEVTVVIQINGKLKTTIQLPKDLDKKLAEEKVLQLQAIQRCA